MKTVDELTSRFRDEGLRVTPQRQAIFRLLHGVDTHPTVESLFEAARSEMPTISRKTVYQTVHDLEEMGEVELLDIGTGSIRVDPNVEHAHQHLVCTECGTVRDVLLDIADLRVPARYRREFTVEAVEVVFRGVCDECSNQRQPTPTDTMPTNTMPTNTMPTNTMPTNTMKEQGTCPT